MRTVSKVWELFSNICLSLTLSNLWFVNCIVVQGIYAPGKRPSINVGYCRTVRGMKPAIVLPPLAAGSSNGLNGTVNGFEKHTSPAEMTVADLSPNLSNTSSSSSIDSACPPEPLRKVAVPPRRPVPADEGKAYQQASTINGRGRKITAQAQRVIDQFVSLTGGGGALTAPNGISSTELAAVESKLKRQSIELREAKAELA